MDTVTMKKDAKDEFSKYPTFKELTKKLGRSYLTDPEYEQTREYQKRKKLYGWT